MSYESLPKIEEPKGFYSSEKKQNLRREGVVFREVAGVIYAIKVPYDDCNETSKIIFDTIKKDLTLKKLLR